MNLTLTNKQAMLLVTLLKKTETRDSSILNVIKQIDKNFQEMEVSQLLKLQDQFKSTFTVEFNINCKCGFNFHSVAVKDKAPPLKHLAKCPNCNAKHLWNAK